MKTLLLLLAMVINLSLLVTQDLIALCLSSRKCSMFAICLLMLSRMLSVGLMVQVIRVRNTQLTLHMIISVVNIQNV